jgi:hypothetical protein
MGVGSNGQRMREAESGVIFQSLSMLLLMVVMMDDCLHKSPSE